MQQEQKNMFKFFKDNRTKMNLKIKLIFIVLTTFFPVVLRAQIDSETIDWEKKCMWEFKVKSRTRYSLKNLTDTINPQWKKTDYDEFDKFGNWSLWRQFNATDTTQYSDYVYQYNGKDQYVGTFHDPVDVTAIMDSAGYNELGHVNYEKLYHSSGEIIMEIYMEYKLNEKDKPVNIIGKDSNGNILSRTTISYGDNDQIIEEKMIDLNDSVISKTVYEYYDNGRIKDLSTTINYNQPYEIKKFNSSSRIIDEIRYSNEQPGDIEYKNTFEYDQQGREIEKVTYSNIFELRPSRRETTEYMDNCLKRKTKIYSIDVLTGKEELYTIFKYNYSFY